MPATPPALFVLLLDTMLSVRVRLPTRLGEFNSKTPPKAFVKLLLPASVDLETVITVSAFVAASAPMPVLFVAVVFEIVSEPPSVGDAKRMAPPIALAFDAELLEMVELRNHDIRRARHGDGAAGTGNVAVEGDVVKRGQVLCAQENAGCLYRCSPKKLRKSSCSTG